MLPSMQYPLVNGFRTDHSSLEVTLNSLVLAVKEIHWESSMEPTAIFANDPAAIGWTRGQYQPSFGFELWLAESEVFEDNLMADPNYINPVTGIHLGVLEVMFPVDIIFSQESTQSPSIFIETLARISKSSLSSTVGAEHHFRKYECKAVTPIAENGRSPFSGAKIINP